MSFSYLIQVFVIGLATGFIYYLTACGLSLIVSGMGIVNVAQGSFFILGVFLAISSFDKIGFLGCVIGVPLVVAVLAIPFERCIRPLYGKNVFYTLLITFALSLVVSDVTYYIWGSKHSMIPIPQVLKGSVKIASVTLPKYYLFICVVGLVIYFAYWLMMEKTKLGKLLRANMYDREMVIALGYNMNVLFIAMLAIAFAMSALGGVLNSGFASYDAKAAVTVFTNVMPIIFIGGLRNMKATLPSALLVGELCAFGAILTPQLYSLLPALLMVIVMLVRPQGLFTKEAK